MAASFGGTAAERRPLLMRRTFSHELEPEPVFACIANPHSHLPVYTNIHRIRRDVVAVVEDYLSAEQLRDMRINISVIRPLVDKLYELDDISIGTFPWALGFGFWDGLELTDSLLSPRQPRPVPLRAVR